MIYDYDLVVIGDSPEAECAAERAGRLRARVAWVTQVPSDQGNEPNAGGNPALRAEVMGQVLRQGIARLGPAEIVADPQALWDKARRYAAIAVAERDPQRLQQVRVDVIEGLGRFETRPRLQLNVEALGGLRELRSRNYLLAPAARPYLPPGAEDNGSDNGSIETLHSWTTWQKLPQQVVLLGAVPEALVLAQILVKLGCAVTAMVRSAQATDLLPSMDLELAELAILLLKASGVTFQLNAGSLQASLEAAQKQVQVLRATGIDARLLLAEGWRPHWPGLNLEALGLSGETAVGVDPQLRTQHQQIYGCGAAVSHGPGRDAMARHQAIMALRNGLWWPWWRSQNPIKPLQPIIKTLPLAPMLTQVGLTEAQAQQQYPGQVTVVRQSAQGHQPSQLKDQTVGLCKLVVHRNGRLLGAQALAAGAEDLMAIAALVLQKKGSVLDIEKLSLSLYASTNLLQAAAAQWRWDRLAESPRREDLIERFFNWRRTGSV